jgi:cation transport regulator ChaC
MSRLYYFAYGSNMLPQQMLGRCPDAQRVGSALLPGWRFLINRRGVATIRKDVCSICRGGVWRISRRDEFFLDQHEGVDTGHYVKALLPVQLRNGRFVEALTYIDRRVQRGTPREGYLLRILAGAVSFKLPNGYLEELISWASESDIEAWRMEA